MLPKVRGHQADFPIDSLELNELLLQWKVMKALGYRSLFDPDFRRELRNPVRRFLYYRIVVAEERQDKKFLLDALTNVSDNISFHTDPELYRKIKKEQERIKIDSGDKKTINKVLVKSQEDFKKYKSMSEQDMKEALEIINR